MIHPLWVTSGLLGWTLGGGGARGEGSAKAIACEGDAEERLEAGNTPRMPLPVPWLAGCGGSSVRAGMALVTGGAGWAGPAAASLTCPALIWTVFTLTGFIGSDEPGIAAIGWVWMTPLVSGAGSVLGSVLGSLLVGIAALACDISEAALAGRGCGAIGIGAD